MARSSDDGPVVACPEAPVEPLTYGWRIRFLLPKSMPLVHDGRTLTLGSTLGFALRPLRREEAIEDSRELVLSQGGYASEDEALESGMRAKTALMLCGARLRVGLNLGKDTAPSGVSECCPQQTNRATGVRVLNDVHGLMVYPEVPPPRFASGSAEVHAGRTPAQFIDAFAAAYAADITLTERQRLALELYASSFFEATVNARFLALVTVIESLADQMAASSRDCECIDRLVAIAGQTELDAERSLLGRLQELKRESVRQATFRLVREHAADRDYDGEPADRLFDRCYRLRSDLLHTGGAEGIGAVVHGLDRLVADVLCAATRLGTEQSASRPAPNKRPEPA